MDTKLKHPPIIKRIPIRACNGTNGLLVQKDHLKDFPVPLYKDVSDKKLFIVQKNTLIVFYVVNAKGSRYK